MDKLLDLIPGYDPRDAAGDCYFDEEAAEDVIGFFADRLHHFKGPLAGQPFVLEPWEQGVAANLFAWKHPDGTRRYEECFIFVPRKNGKTTFMAGLVLYVLFCDGEPGAEIFSLAGAKEQASLIFDIAKAMVLAEPSLDSNCRVYRKSIVIESIGSSYKPLPADADTQHGYNTHFAVFDELHIQKNRDLVDAIDTSTGARQQPLIVYITTSDYDRESICNEKYDEAVSVRDNGGDQAKIGYDPAFLPVIYEAKKDDDWHDEKVWAKANPNLDISISLKDLRRKHKKAVDQPRFENTFRRLHLNQRTQQADRWIQMDDWNACGAAVVEDDLVGRRCWGGLDLATVSDLAAFALAFEPEEEDGPWDLLLRFWCPQEGAEQRQKTDKVPYLVWAKAGLITLTDGATIDYRHIRAEVKALADQFALEDVGYDPYNATHIARQLEEEDGIEMIEFRQGWLSMNEPCKYFERMLIGGRLRHGGNAVLNWMAGNVCVKTDESNNIRPDKKRSFEKIDGIVAVVMALGRGMANTVSDEGGSASPLIIL